MAQGSEIEILRAAQAWGAVRTLLFEYTCKSRRLREIEGALGRAGFELYYPQTLLGRSGSDGIVFCSRTSDCGALNAACMDGAQGGADGSEAGGDEDESEDRAWLEPDHLVNVSGKFAGLWVLRRNETKWASASAAAAAAGGGVGTASPAGAGTGIGTIA
eukprot:SAG11_NODE_6141_length_1379_cov_1.930469_1_plen_159_part_10